MSVLYSDVGDYYSRVKRRHPNPALAAGWEIVGPRNVAWSVDDSLPPASEKNGTLFSKLDEDDLESICNQDAMLLRGEVRSSTSSSAFTILPSSDQLQWPLLRCKFYDSFRHPSSRYDFPHIDDWGCQSGASGSEDWAFAVWSYNFTERTLAILRLRCKTPAQLQEIVRRAQNAAVRQGMELITAWNVAEDLLTGTGWRNVERKEHLPAMAWYGEEARPQWLCNEVRRKCVMPEWNILIHPDISLQPSSESRIGLGFREDMASVYQYR